MPISNRLRRFYILLKGFWTLNGIIIEYQYNGIECLEILSLSRFEFPTRLPDFLCRTVSTLLLFEHGCVKTEDIVAKNRLQNIRRNNFKKYIRVTWSAIVNFFSN